mgnify:CR=1 FL=1
MQPAVRDSPPFPSPSPRPWATPAGVGAPSGIRPRRLPPTAVPDLASHPPTGVLMSATFLGREIDYDIVCGADHLRVRTPSPVTRHNVGDTVSIQLPSEIPPVR